MPSLENINPEYPDLIELACARIFEGDLAQLQRGIGEVRMIKDLAVDQGVIHFIDLLGPKLMRQGAITHRDIMETLEDFRVEDLDAQRQE
jgi:hypothetical protein